MVDSFISVLYLAALFVGLTNIVWPTFSLFSVVVGRPLCRYFLRWWSAQPQVPLKEYYGGSPEIGFGQAVGGAFIGSLSHVFLDSLMHSDLRPLIPFNDQNAMFDGIGPGTIHLVCFLLAIVGALVCARMPNSKL